MVKEIRTRRVEDDLVKDKLFWEALAAGGCMMLFSYLLFDRLIFNIIPIFWPVDLLDAVMKQLRFPFILEIVLRFGLVTLVYRLNKNAGRAVLYVALFYTIGAINNQIINFDIRINNYSWFILSGCYLLISNLLSGYFYVKGGILYSILFQLVFGIRYYFYLMEL